MKKWRQPSPWRLLVECRTWEFFFQGPGKRSIISGRSYYIVHGKNLLPFFHDVNKGTPWHAQEEPIESPCSYCYRGGHSEFSLSTSCLQGPLKQPSFLTIQFPPAAKINLESWKGLSFLKVSFSSCDGNTVDPKNCYIPVHLSYRPGLGFISSLSPMGRWPPLL